MKRPNKRNANRTDSAQSIVSQRRRALSKLLLLLDDDHRRILERDDAVRRTADASATPTTDEPLREPLRRLRLGQITVAEYLDIKVDQAMARVQGLIPEDDFRHLRTVIRERVETDPVLVALVQRVSSTPGAPAPHEFRARSWYFMPRFTAAAWTGRK